MKQMRTLLCLIALCRVSPAFSQLSVADSTRLAAQHAKIVAYFEKSMPDSAKERIYAVLPEIRKLLQANPGNLFVKAQQIEAMDYLSAILYEQGRLVDAIAYADTVRRYFELARDSFNLALSLNNIGYMYQSQSMSDKALEAYAAAFQILDKSREAEAKMYCGVVLNNTGLIYEEKKLYDSTLFFHQRALKIRREVKDERGISESLNNIGNTLRMMERTDEALPYLQEALAIKRKINDVSGLTYTLNNIAIIHYLKGDLKKSLEYAEESNEMAKRSGNMEALLQVSLTLSKDQYGIGNYKKAYDYLDLFVKYNDSLSSINNKKALYKNQVRYEFDKREALLQAEQEKKETQIKLLSAENQLKDAKARDLVIILIIAFALAITLFFFFRNKAKIARELGSKNVIIENALGEKEVLLKEIHHRVKNNLQIISSLLNLQQGLAGGQSAEEILKICESRIQSMAIIHEKLYQSENFREIDFNEYLTDFMEHLSQSLLFREKNIGFTIQCADIKLDIDRLVPCSLVLNELMINSVKHGLKNRQNGWITIACSQEAGWVKLLVSDNGKGLPADFDFDGYRSLGVRLVNGLVKQIKGTISVERRPEEGAAFLITFPLG